MTEPEPKHIGADIVELQDRLERLRTNPAVMERTRLATIVAQEEREQAEIERVAKIERDHAAMIARHIPKRFRHAAPENMSPDAIRWAEQVLSDDEADSMMLLGNVGTGKSHNAYGAVRMILEARGERGVVCYSSPLLLERLRPDGRDGLLDEVLGAGVLLLDDFGSEKPSAWVAERLYIIMNSRYEAILPTVITTNTPAAQFPEVFGERLTSRLSQMCERVVLEGPDRRMG